MSFRKSVRQGFPRAPEALWSCKIDPWGGQNGSWELQNGSREFKNGHRELQNVAWELQNGPWEVQNGTARLPKNQISRKLLSEGQSFDKRSHFGVPEAVLEAKMGVRMIEKQ